MHIFWSTPWFVKWYKRVKILLILEFVMEGKLKERSLTPRKKKGGESFEIGQGGAHKFMQSEINLHKLKNMTISAKMVHI